MKVPVPIVAALLGVFAPGCSEEGGDCPAILFYSQLELRFVPTEPGYDSHVAVYEDNTIDGVPERLVGIELEANASYAMTVELALYCYGSHTDELREHATEYQLVFQGDGVMGPASATADPVVTHSYADQDANGLPLGLSNLVVANRASQGSLSVMLLTLPAKTAGLAEYIRDNQRDAWPGHVDAQFQLPIAIE